MALEKKTVPYCLNVVWDELGNLRGAAFYENELVVDGDTIVSAKQGNAQPVAILGQKGIDINGLIGKIGADAIALAEQKAALLDTALADVTRLTGERDGWQAQCTALRAELAAMQPPPVPQRVATTALLFVLRKMGLRDQFDAALASLPADQAEDARELLAMPYTRRDHPLVAMVQQAFGWTDAEVDALFAEADLV